MNKIICWWSGGVTSAVACKVAIDLYGIENCRVIMIDTKNEDVDSYRFLKDCEKWYGTTIERITGIGDKYKTIQDVWRKNKSLNVASGAICSSELKRRVREDWQKDNSFEHQVFGFEFDSREFKRAYGMTNNNPSVKPIYPLMMMGYNKEDCIEILTQAEIEIPRMYTLGFRNNNCFQTGCVQGGIGYWKKMQKEFPHKFEAMAKMEHELTDSKGEPVTMLKDQSSEAKIKVAESGLNWKGFIFLKKHPNYPDVITIDDKKGRAVKPLFECNGFCGTNDLAGRVGTEQEINFNPS